MRAAACASCGQHALCDVVAHPSAAAPGRTFLLCFDCWPPCRVDTRPARRLARQHADLLAARLAGPLGRRRPSQHAA